jgi:hypothetical protein
MIISSIEEQQAVVQAVKRLGLADFNEVMTEVAFTGFPVPARFEGPNANSLLKACLKFLTDLALIKKSFGPNGMECWSIYGYPLPEQMQVANESK